MRRLLAIVAFTVTVALLTPDWSWTRYVHDLVLVYGGYFGAVIAWVLIQVLVNASFRRFTSGKPHERSES